MLLLISYRPANAQIPEDCLNYWNTLTEELTEDAATDWHNTLEDLYKNKLELNKDSKEQLLLFPFFTEQIAAEIVAYRTQYQGFISIYELQQIHSLRMFQLHYLLPFITLEAPKSGEKIEYVDCYSIQNRPLVAGKMTGNYIGGPVEFGLKYLYRSNQLEIGFRLQKDSYEQWKSINTFPYIDYSSAYIQFSKLGRLQQAILGDFELSFAEGLSISTASFLGSIYGIERIKRASKGIQPYRSNRENNMLRGIALQFAILKGHLSLFAAFSSYDASLNDSGYLQSIREMSGLHRTESELNTIDRQQHRLLGFHYNITRKYLHLGLTSYQRKVAPAITQLEEDYIIRSSVEGNRTALNYSYSRSTLFLFGELAVMNSRADLIQGMSLSLNGKTDWTCLYRHYSPGNAIYQRSPYSGSSNFSGERGIYTSLRYTNKASSICWSQDLYRNVKINTSINAATWNSRLNVEYRKMRRNHYDLQLRYLRLMSLQKQVEEIGWNIFPLIKNEFRVQYVYYLAKDRYLKLRFDHKNAASSNGSLIYVDYSFKSSKHNIRYSFRYANCSLDDGPLFYSYETVPAGNNPSYIYSSSSQRIYAFMRMNPRPNLKVSFRYAFTHSLESPQHYEEVISLGSGNDRIIPGQKHTFAVQIHLDIK